jgi:hypothetical protein
VRAEVQTQPWLGWVVVSNAPAGVGIAVGNRGVGHDEPPMYMSATLCARDALKLAREIVSMAELVYEDEA